MHNIKLGASQESFLFHALSGGDFASTMQQHVLYLSSKHSYNAILDACLNVINEQPSLRTILHEGIDEYELKLGTTKNVPLKEIIISKQSDGNFNNQLNDLFLDDRLLSFQENTPPCRFTVVKASESELVILWTVSNILVDTYSVGIVFNRILEYLSDSQTTPIDPDITWKKIREFNDKYSTDTIPSVFDFWKTHLDAIEPTSWLSAQVSNDDNRSSRTFKAQAYLGSIASKKLCEFIQINNLNWPTIAESTWALLIQRYTNRPDVIFGVEHDLRDKGNVNTVGVLSNIVLRRFSIPRNTAIDIWLAKEQLETDSLIINSNISIPKLLDISGLSRDINWINSLVRVKNQSNNTLECSYCNADKVYFETKYELPGIPIIATLLVDNDISIEIAVRNKESDDATANQILGHWKKLLKQIADQSISSPSFIKITSDQEEKLVNKWNQTDTPHSNNKCVHTLFSEQASKTPDRIAVSTNDQTLSYHQLDIMSDDIANLLVSKGVVAESRVAVCLPRSIELPVAILGVLKAGGAYVPIDPTYPKERISLMLGDSNVQAAITQKSISTQIDYSNIPIISLESVWDLQHNSYFKKQDTDTRPYQLAYVIYTSGSTGHPKGIAMEHRPLVNLIEWQNKISSNLPSHAHTLHFSPLSFDVSFQELFSTLCSGGQLFIITEEIRHNPYELWNCIENNSINRIYLPFVSLQQLAEAAIERDSLPNCLYEVITAGEKLKITPQIVGMFDRIPQARLHNQYGPSETHVVTSLTLNGKPTDWPYLPTIGKPIANTRTYILDAVMNPAPIGGIGEIYVGGMPLARGYLNRQELTNECFLPDPFQNTPNSRMYKTGDLGRYTPDGNIEFLGRIDDQVKIRGFRVELAEIEASLRDYSSILDCVVNAWDHNGENRLVAYIRPKSREMFNEGYIREQIRLKMPSYMCPGSYVLIDNFPKTPSGKINRRELPAPVMEQSTFRILYEEAKNETEKYIVNIWQEVLGIDNVGRNDRFFDLGGTSLQIIQVHRKLENIIKKKIPITKLFQYVTVASLAMNLKNDDEADTSNHKELRNRAMQQRQAVLRQARNRLP